MESATPGVKSTRDGWLNRYLQVAQEADSPLTAVAMTRQMPRSLQGHAPALAMGSVGEFGVRGGMAARDSFEAAYAAAADQVLKGTASEAFAAMRTLSTAAVTKPVPVRRTAPSTRARRSASRCRRSRGSPRRTSVSRSPLQRAPSGTITSTKAAPPVRLRIASPTSRAASPRWRRTSAIAWPTPIILTMSEFGRAVAENGNRGTDHGHGNAMMLIGGGVKGGEIYGDWPGLNAEQRFEGRDLTITTDFRDVFGEVVMRHLGAS